MNNPGPNLAASSHQRILHIARSTGQDFQQLLTRFTIERLLVRLVESPHAGEFILKGAMLFVIWVNEPYRATVDLDLLGHGSIDEGRMRHVFTDLANSKREDDALEFDASSITLRRIREGELYEGIQVLIPATLGKARIRVKVDVGFGDAVTPAPTTVRFPTLLGLSPLVVRAYPRETVVAEKVHAMVTLGMANSRMKDFYDVWFLSQRFDFDGTAVFAALRATFKRRQTPPSEETPISLTEYFALDEGKEKQWSAFVRKTRLHVEPPPFVDLLAQLRTFALPLINSLATDTVFSGTWPGGGPWRLE